ncbi:MAG TPA: sugar phosphate isomerase/epimerase [Dehalococcoidia bacterium]|nr:sugar phosphate isomerase/epimerase [Dehalococcoidia bacterium]
MAPPIHSLSTMWSQGNFKRDGDGVDHMPAFAEKAAGLGFGHVEINYVIPPASVDELIDSGRVAFSSVHSPCPRVKMPDGRHSEHYNLAAQDQEERRLAVEVARASVDTAVRAGCNLLVVHLGGIGSKMFDEEQALRKGYDNGLQSGPEFDRLVASARKRRAEAAPGWFPHAQRSLAELAEYAAPRGVTIGLENRYHFSEFPDPDEMQLLLRDYPPEVAGFWLDIGHAEVLERLGFHDHTRWLDEIGGRCVGTHVHDVDGLADHRAPGHGTSDWPHYAAKLPPLIPRVYEINQKQPAEWVAEATPFLREVGVLPRA